MADHISPETERDATLVRDLALAFAAGRYEGGETLFDMYANIALKFMETRGLAQTPAALTILRKALEEICAGPLNTGAIYRGIALGALDQIAALSDTSTDRQQPVHPNGDTVTVKIPDGYDSAWDFLNDCGLEAVTPVSSPDRSSE